MKFTAENKQITIDFERQDSLWCLLVVDDRWDFVKRMVYGFGSVPGLGENSVDGDIVEGYWNARRRGQKETFIYSLLLLPWIAYNEKSISKITFSDFPSETFEPNWHSLVESEQQQLAALIDVTAEDGDTIRFPFEDAWIFLEKTSCSPACARAIFSRGGNRHELHERFDNVHGVSKSQEEGGKEAFRTEFEKWWKGILGGIDIGRELFLKETDQKYTHDPSTLPECTPIEIVNILSHLKRHDPYGVWTWCGQGAPFKTIDDEFKIKWLCAKAYQKTASENNTVPIAALIGICNGVKYLEPKLGSNYTVTIKKYDEFNKDIDSILVLGVITLSSQGYYVDFASALRNWLIHPEQFKDRNGYICSVEIDWTATEATIMLTYTTNIFTSIFADANKDDGRVKWALKGLKTFCSEITCGDNIMTMKFNKNDG